MLLSGVLQIASQVDAEAAMREVFTTFMALQRELFGDDASRWQRLGLVGAVGCILRKQRCMHWQLHELASGTLPASVVVSTGVKPVLQQLLVAASMHLSNFVDASIPDRWKVVRVVQDERKRGLVFGEGVWMVPWREFVTRAQHSLCMRDEADTLAFARHVEKIGAVLLLGGSVDSEVSGDRDRDDGDTLHRWVVCIRHNPELVDRALVSLREIVRV